MKARIAQSSQLSMSLMVRSSTVVIDARARAEVVRMLAELLLAAADAEPIEVASAPREARDEAL